MGLIEYKQLLLFFLSNSFFSLISWSPNVLKISLSMGFSNTYLPNENYKTKSRCESRANDSLPI